MKIGLVIACSLGYFICIAQPELSTSAVPDSIRLSPLRLPGNGLAQYDMF